MADPPDRPKVEFAPSRPPRRTLAPDVSNTCADSTDTHSPSVPARPRRELPPQLVVLQHSPLELRAQLRRRAATAGNGQLGL